MTASRNDVICRAYNRGGKVRAIADEHGISTTRVRQIVRERGFVVRPTGRPRGYAR